VGIDSSANLLFNISADAGEAQGNIQRFRGLLSKDLDAMGAEFGQWSNSVFGNLSTVKGALIGVTAGLAAMAVGVGAALVRAAESAAHYAEEIEDGTHKTGLSAEQMSRLRYAAKNADLGYQELVGSLVKFETNVMKAQTATGYQGSAFQRLNISQNDVKAGAENLLPLLYKVADAFHERPSSPWLTALSRELAGRTGAGMIEFLRQGSEGIKVFGERAEQMGRVLTEKDLVAAKAFRLELIDLKAQMEALQLSAGKFSLPGLTESMVFLDAYGNFLRKLPETLKETYKTTTWWETLIPGKSAFNLVRNELASFGDEVIKARTDLAARVKAAMPPEGNKTFPGVPAEISKATENFWGLSSVLEQVKTRLAGTAGEEARISAETAHLNFQLDKASAEFLKLWNQGKMLPEALKRETTALYALPSAIAKLQADAIKVQRTKQNLEFDAAATDLQQRLIGQQEQTAATQVAAWHEEIARLKEQLAKKTDLRIEQTALLINKIADLERAGENRLARERTEAFTQQLLTLQQELAGIMTARQTSAERIRWTYDQDLQRFSEVEEAKALKGKTSEAEIAATRAQYDMLRGAAFARYGEELSTLYNSQGWQGVFGNHFTQYIRENEQLLREWSSSADQSMSIVRVAVESLGTMSRKAFMQFAQGMGQNIANAIVYKKTIGEAMQAATAATISAFAAEAMIAALVSAGYGFYYLGRQMYQSAAFCFTAAAMFGSVGTVAAVAGRAIAPSSAGSKGESNSAGTSSSASSSSTSSSASQGPSVTINVSGHIIGSSGIEELTDIINEAVTGRDVRLISTATKLAGVVSR
jgi:hypothetical protein